MNLLKSEHFVKLNQSYDFVGSKTWIGKDFSEDSLENSRVLFTKNSLNRRKPVPKELEVYAFLSGIEFPENVIYELKKIQSYISAIIGDSLHYWVKPENFGLEYGVFKWPEGKWNQQIYIKTINLLEKIKIRPFVYHIIGFQINPDGCIIVKGFDEGANIFSVREKFQASLSFYPKRQSQWAHIPIGRILEPVGREKFIKLKNLVRDSEKNITISHQLNCGKLVHETRWYMEEKTILLKVPFI